MRVRMCARMGPVYLGMSASLHRLVSRRRLDVIEVEQLRPLEHIERLPTTWEESRAGTRQQTPV